VLRLTLALLCGATLSLTGSLTAADPPSAYILPPGNHADENIGFASSSAVAIGGGFMVIGSPKAIRPLGALKTGGVYVFNATTGAYIRAIYPADGLLNDFFGFSVAISGNVLVVGAPLRDQPAIDSGVAYLYNLSTGALIRRINPPVGFASVDLWGTAVACEGDIVAIGGTQYLSTGGVFTHQISINTSSVPTLIGPAFQRLGSSLAVWRGMIAVGGPGIAGADGRVELRQASDLSLLTTIFDTPGLMGGFGTSVAMDAGRLIVGAPENGGGAGRVRIYDISLPSTPVQLQTINSAGTERFGSSVATKDRVFAVGVRAANGGRGLVRVFDGTMSEIGRLNPAAATASARLGSSVAFGRDGTLIASVPLQEINGSGVGGLWRAGPFLQPLQQRIFALSRSKETASGAALANYSTFPEISTSYLSTDYHVSYLATLTGTGAAGGRTKGLWSTLNQGTSAGPGLTIQTAVATPLGLLPTPTVTLSSVTRPVYNGYSQQWFKGTKTTGISVFSSDTTNGIQEKIVAGTPLFIGGPVPLILYDLHVPNNSGVMALPIKLKPGTGTPAVTAASDSMMFKTDGNPIQRREGVTASPAPGIPLWGQFSPRASCTDQNNTIFDAFVQSTPVKSGVFHNVSTIVMSGDVATNASGAAFPVNPTTAPSYSAFLGESAMSSSVGNSLIFRATLKIDAGAGVTAANNEGLWIKRGVTPVHLAARKGDLIAGTPLKWSKFIDYSIDHYNDVLILAQVTGPGVTAANDQVLICLFTGVAANTEILLREGSAAPGCDGARIGVMSTIDMAFENGSRDAYGVLATLIVQAGGATAGNNLVWLVGDLAPGSGLQQSMRLPSAYLRKGERYATIPGQDTITSIVFPATLRDASGAGNTGMAHVLTSRRDTTAVITFPDKSTALVMKYY